MSLHKLSAGSGYTYLTRQVAAADATHRGHISLGDFYAAKGESPGLWTGSGLSGLDGVNEGDQVSVEQMKALFGEGRHPNAHAMGTAMIANGHSPARALQASKLGLAFFTYASPHPLRVAVSRAFVEHNKSLGRVWNARISTEVRRRIRAEAGAEMFADAYLRPPRNQRELSGFIATHSVKATAAVAGFDLTFSPVKSVSALWAVAPPEVASQIQEAQRCAVASTLGWLEREAAFTRTFSSRVRHVVESTGLVAAAFTHRDSRSGDPDLHTHVAVSNKVQTLDGRWRALHSPLLFTAAAAARQRYDTRIEAELIARLGLRFAARADLLPRRHPIREVVGVDPMLNAFWSSRRAEILVRLGVLSAAFGVDHGRAPTIAELRRLAQQSTLETRAAKHNPRAYVDQRIAWRAQAAEILGGEEALEAMITLATGSRARGRTVAATGATGQTVTGQWVDQTATAVVAQVSVWHPTWRVWNVRAETEWAARTAGIALADVDRAVDAVVARALSPAYAVRQAEPASWHHPGGPRRRDGSSVYSVPGETRFTSGSILTSPADLAAPRQPRDEPAAVLEVAPVLSAAGGPGVNPAQSRADTTMATSASRLQPAPTRAETKEKLSRAGARQQEADDEALFQAARQRAYSPGPDLDAFDTERQWVETNTWDHAPVARARLLELNELAADFFAAGYAHSWGPEYVSGRLGTDLADHPGFRPGYAPAGWTHLCEHLRHLGASDQEILAAGLARVAGTGHIIAQFRGRLVMPVRDGDQIHGFIGRRHPAEPDPRKAGPKYLNTASTDLFDKGAHLFGLCEQRAALNAGAMPVLVEGFFDAIAVTLAGGDRYVGLACLGTSITAAQANLLRPYAGVPGPGGSGATDADVAGQVAAQRAFWLLAARGHVPRHVLLAEGQDPAAVLQHDGPEVLRCALDEAQPLARVLLDERLSHQRDNPQAVPECADVIAAQPPRTWAEQIDYAAARTTSGAPMVQQAVAAAAPRWTLDPLSCAESQIGNLASVRTRLQRAAQPRSSAHETGDLGPATGLGAGSRVGSAASGQTSSSGATGSGATTAEVPPLGSWLGLAHGIAPLLTAADDWPILSRAIQEAAAAGYAVAGGLAGLASEGTLSPQHPATELAYRLRAASAVIASDLEPISGPDPNPAPVTSASRPHPGAASSLRPRGRPMR